MRTRTSLRSAIPAIVAVCLVAAAGGAGADLVIPREASDVTVVLADGWRLEDVDARWDPVENVLVIERGEMGRRLRPEDIRAVVSVLFRPDRVAELPLPIGAYWLALVAFALVSLAVLTRTLRAHQEIR